MKLGKKAATHDERDLCFSKYLAAGLPTPPDTFGHQKLVGDWQMMGNDQYGCCVFAGAAHETMLWNREASRTVSFDDRSVLSDYSAVTGFDPKDPASDQGTNVREALKYRRKIGVLDASGQRHKIGGFVALKPGNLEHLRAALYIFSSVSIGFNFPLSAMKQFNAGKPWTVTRSALDGGHYVPLVAQITQNMLACVTWGKLQLMALAFYEKYCDEAYAILSTEMLSAGKTLEGFDLPQLQADLKLVA